MVGNVTIQGQITGTATFDGAKISAVVTIAPQITATVNFGVGISTVEQLPAPVSDSSNIYTWIRGTLLTGLAALSDVTITVEDTILSAFAKLQGQINAVKSRVGLLEDSYLLRYVVPTDAVLINLTTDKYGNRFNFTDGDKIEIVMQVKRFVGDVVNRVNFRVNNYTGPYVITTVGNADSMITAGTSYLSNYFSATINVVGGEIQGFIHNESKRSATTYGSDLYSFYTVGLNAQSITSFNFSLNNSLAAIPAGTILLIRKIKC